MKEIVNICSSFMPADNIGGPAFCGFDLLNQIDKICDNFIIFIFNFFNINSF